MAVVSMNNLLEAGVHFGHQTKRWNPKMKEYIFTSRDGIHIIDLDKTSEMLEAAYNVINEIARNGGNFLFVGTKKQASEVSREEADRCASYYVSERWLGGTLTNFRTIRSRVKRLEEIEEMEASGIFDSLPKKEVIGLKKEYDKLNRVLGGIRKMTKLPQGLIIVDPKKELSAIKEARKLNIPVFGIVDTNCDPDDVDYIIPANDDAVRSVKVILGVLANAIADAKNLEMVDYISEEDKKAAKQEAEKVQEVEVKKAENVELPKVKEEIKTAEVKSEVVEETEKEEKSAKEDFSEKTLTELKALAKDKGLKGYSTLKKDELIAALS